MLLLKIQLKLLNGSKTDSYGNSKSLLSFSNVNKGRNKINKREEVKKKDFCGLQSHWRHGD
jgi:hypothetical protein